ncbi:major surface protein 1B-1 [Anaplasma centrale str. Israel]|uniref:Major surface protein 1B-1 n=1 Tax=Anaplasma centrale (strain Israel) TaxID=574556 RepID=D1ASW4_ANACI|nr:major surface protein 1B-1 [Anaplasma centrale]ACZ49567.1 major surface protein 1B-1 [Anaplasma centrale str. Israel]
MDEDKQQVMQALRAAFGKNNEGIKKLDNISKLTRQRMTNLDALQKELETKAALVKETNNKFNHLTGSAALRAKATAALQRLGAAITGKSSGKAFEPADIDNMPFMDSVDLPADMEITEPQTGEEKKEFGRATAYGLTGLKHTIDEGVEMLGRGMHMVGEGQAKVAQGVEAKDVELVKAGLELSGLGTSMCWRSLSDITHGLKAVQEGPMGKVAGKGLEKCREKLEAASQKWFSAWQEVDALGTAVSRGEQELEAAAKEGEGEAWSPKGVESNAFYKALNTIGQKIADAAQATWEGLAITGKFIGNAAKIAGVGALCTAAILTAMVPVVSLPMFAAMGISPTADAWIQNKIEKAEKFVDDQMSDAARGLAASELVTAVSGALVAVGAGFQYIFTPVHNAIKGSVEEGLYKIKEGVQETNQSIMAKFNAVGQAMTNAGVYAVAAIRQGFSAETRNLLLQGIEAVYNSIKEFVTGLAAPIGSYDAVEEAINREATKIQKTEVALDAAKAPSLVTNLKNAGVITTEEAQRLERPAPSISSVARRLGYGAQALAAVVEEEPGQDAKDLAAKATPAEREAVDNAIKSVVSAVQNGQAPELEAVIAAIEGAAMDSTVEKPAQDRGVEQASQSKDGIEGIDQDALKEAAEGFTGAVEAAEGQVAPLNAAEVAAAQGHQQSSGMSR